MQGQRVGYVRVSTFEQNTQRQLDQIPVDRIFTDKASGKDAQRPELESLLAFVREGDTVVVHSMDRLARNLDDLRRLVQKLVKRGIRIEFIKERLTFTGEDSPMATLMLSVMGAFAEFERSLMRERQREGIALAKPARRLPRPQAIPHRRPDHRPEAPYRRRRRQGSRRARTRSQSGNGLSVLASPGVAAGVFAVSLALWYDRLTLKIAFERDGD